MKNDSLSHLFKENEYINENYMACSGIDEPHENYYGAVAPALIQTSLFVQKNYQQYCDDMLHEAERYIYSRGLNPTVEMLEKKLARLEVGAACKCFSSGMGAISATLLSIMNSGDHIILVSNIYGPTIMLIEKMAEKYHIEYDIVLSNSIDDIKRKIKPQTKAIYTESPATMTMKIVDLTEIAKLAKKHSITTIIDNTWSTPIFQKPISLGFDIVIHSCTKYIGGHSDLTGGAVISSMKYIDKIRDFSHQLIGAIMSPNTAWLLLRGLRTLPMRMENHQKNTIEIIRFLSSRPEIENICHPYFADDAQRAIIKKQMYGFSGLFSFELKNGDFTHVKKFIDSCSTFKIGCSWGGYESLIISPNRGYNQDSLLKSNISPGLIRVSIGHENPDILIRDLVGALGQLSKV